VKNKIPFVLLEGYAQSLIDLMATAKTVDKADHYKKLYLKYLSECGWTDQEFNMALLSQVDKDWEPSLN